MFPDKGIRDAPPEAAAYSHYPYRTIVTERWEYMSLFYGKWTRYCNPPVKRVADYPAPFHAPPFSRMRWKCGSCYCSVCGLMIIFFHGNAILIFRNLYGSGAMLRVSTKLLDNYGKMRRLTETGNTPKKHNMARL